KAHLDGLDTLTFACLAAASGGVERKAACGVAANASFRCGGVNSPNGVPEANVRGRAGARCFADGCLVDFQHAIDVLDARHGAAADELDRLRLAEELGEAAGYRASARFARTLPAAAASTARLAVLAVARRASIAVGLTNQAAHV